MVLIIISAALFILYSLMIFYYWAGWRAVINYKLPAKTSSLTISIVISARNEEKNIGALLKALNEQTYPKQLFEVIVINDNSTDRTSEVVNRFPFVKLLDLSPDVHSSHKKRAIELGIANAKHELIVTTDADCIPTVHWLENLAGFKEEQKAVFIAAPVKILITRHSALNIFQSLDFTVLQGITAASVKKHFHTMCNGANIAYEKKIFQEVNGFDGIDNIASGDDMLLMYKIWKKHPQKVFYLKATDVIMETAAAKTWKEFFSQRIRWASKATHYDDKRIFFVLLLVYLFNLSFLLLAIGGFWLSFLWIVCAGLWLGKTIVEFPFVYSVAKFFDQQRLMKYFFLFQPLHIFYTILAGFLGQFGYTWKERKLK
jgi:biofilm PGA synthesis N-glycosyltransferase PgaC